MCIDLKVMIKLKDILKEVGEGTAKPYKYTRSMKHNSIEYKFRTDSNIDYTITIDPYTTEMDVRFIAMDPSKGEEATYQDETNKGEQFRIMATVVLAVKEELQKQPQITAITFDPAKSFKDDDRRAKFYKAYIEKQIPGSKLSVDFAGEYKIQLPKK